jgi:4,5-DOPA dioxygenase extradiol
VPTPEHYLPLLYVLGARRDGDVASFHNVGYFGTVSMTSVLLN